MKFGRKINNDLYNEWKEYYLNYSGLKRVLKERTSVRHWTDEDEHTFTELLEQELDKIHDFQKAKTSELSHRIRDAEKSVKRLVDDYEHSDDNEQLSPQDSPVDAESQQRHHRIAQDAGSDDDDSDDENGDGHSLDALEDQFHTLEEEVATLVADVHDLALYTKLNITGFMKILKKHDKQTSVPLKPTFIQEYLEKRPFYKYNFDSIIVKLSKLYDLVRTRGHPVQGDSSAGGNQNAFVRQTTKYWVHPDNLVRLKLAILKHLPVLVFNADKEYDANDAAITSIYLDNEDLELYLGRLEKTEGAEAIRLRWYGDTDVKTIFVERKTHREDWTGEKSVKARFVIKEHLVNAFLRGEYNMEDEFEELVKKGKKTRQEVDAMIQLANEVQYAILTRKLKPVMRTFYNRTAFQLPGDARVRISLDTELTMVREDNWDGAIRCGDNWRRTDIGIDHPFGQLPPEDKELFRYGVLEVKLQTQYGQPTPQWVVDLVQSHLVEAVPKFSKFIHGCSTLLPNRVDLVPFWLPQMDADILKPDTGSVPFQRPIHSLSRQNSREASGSSGSRTPEVERIGYVEPVSEGEEDEEMDLTPAKDEHKRIGLSAAEVDEAVAFREKTLKENQLAAAHDNGGDDANERTPFLQARRVSRNLQNGKARALSIDPLTFSSAFDETLRDRLKHNAGHAKYGAVGENEHEADDDDEIGLDDEQQASSSSEERILSRNFLAPPGKRIAVPVRIEPKVYFAAERTFLKWLHFSIYIGGIATALLNFIKPGDTNGLIAASMFTFSALVAIAYSAIIFVYRSLRLRTRSAEGLYYDKYGPTVLCVILVVALATNVVLRLSDL